jgi:hypothetical protein
MIVCPSCSHLTAAHDRRGCNACACRIPSASIAALAPNATNVPPRSSRFLHLTKQPGETWPGYLALTLLKIAMALLSFGIYPLAPLTARWHRRYVVNTDIRREQYRQRVRAIARERNRAGQ